MVTPVNETLIAIQSLDVVCVCNGSVVKNAGKNVIKKKGGREWGVPSWIVGHRN